MMEMPLTTEDYGGDGVDYSPHFLHLDDFPSFDAAVTWAKETAIRHGFLLFIASDAPQWRKRKDWSGFFIAVKAGEHGKHNHELVAYPEGHRQIGGLSPKVKQLVREMSDAQTKPSQIVIALQQKFPTDNPTVRHAATDMYGCICQLFYAHPTSVQLFCTWPYVVGIDSTYKTNKYNMPLVETVGVTPCNDNLLIGYALLQKKSSGSYQWVLECFGNILGESVQLSTIVTDRDFGLTKALAQVFTQTTHLLCTCHINEDMANRV
ncbi:Protein FAR-RED ELONGATED HYPOCOTYL 3 [Bienertia sinuspersici]